MSDEFVTRPEYQATLLSMKESLAALTLAMVNNQTAMHALIVSEVGGVKTEVGGVKVQLAILNGSNAANTKFRVQAQAIIAVVSALALAWGATAIILLAKL